MSARSSLAFVPALIGAVMLTTVPASAQSISEVAVPGRAPTQIAISLAGKSFAAVRGEVRVAAGTVCRNAISNRELAFYDLGWCKDRSAAKAMRRYAAIQAKSGMAAGPATIVLSSR